MKYYIRKAYFIRLYILYYFFRQIQRKPRRRRDLRDRGIRVFFRTHYTTMFWENFVILFIKAFFFLTQHACIVLTVLQLENDRKKKQENWIRFQFRRRNLRKRRVLLIFFFLYIYNTASLHTHTHNERIRFTNFGINRTTCFRGSYIRRVIYSRS